MSPSTHQQLTRTEAQLAFTLVWVRDDAADVVREIGRELAAHAENAESDDDRQALLEAAARTRAAADAVAQLAAIVPGLAGVWANTYAFVGETASRRRMVRCARRLV